MILGIGIVTLYYEEIDTHLRKIYVRDREGYFQGTLDGWNDE